MTPSRYTEPPMTLAGYADLVWVVCPKCEQPAVVKTDRTFRGAKGTLICRHCAFSRQTDSTSWMGPLILYGRRPCGRCGHQWVTVSTRVKQASDRHRRDIDAVCPVCDYTSSVQCDFFPARFSSKPHDPCFGLPLLLQTTVRGHVIWAYNQRHLNDLQAYISASLRERNGSGKWSWITRLPEWIKNHKNRRSLLKAVASLQSIAEKLPSI